MLEEIRPLSQLGAEKIMLPPKPDGQTDRQTYGRTYEWTLVSIE